MKNDKGQERKLKKSKKSDSTMKKSKTSKKVQSDKSGFKSQKDNSQRTSIQTLLEKREEIRKGRPSFIRQESWRYVRIKKSWRRPKGIDSKMRLHRKGWPALVDIGYGGPSISRGLHPSGYKEVIVKRIIDMENMNPEIEAVRISGTIGSRKRKEIITRAEELGLKVLNPCGLRFMKSDSKGSEKVS